MVVLYLLGVLGKYELEVASSAVVSASEEIKEDG